MKRSPVIMARSVVKQRTRGQASVRIVVLVLGFFVLGIGLSAFWFSRAAKSRAANAGQETNGREVVVLSDGTKAVLQHLDSPVEIRFYTLLDQAGTSAALPAFADRVNQLLAQCAQESGGKIKVIRYNSRLDSDMRAATADGIKPFNLDKGDACFLGLAVVCAGRKESLPQIQPEWEAALESDLARAILHVTTVQSSTTATKSTQTSPEVTNEIVRLIPDLNGTSLEDGTRILREAAFKKFTEAGAEMENQVNAAQQQLSDAQKSRSETEQQAAMKHLQQVQFEQTEKLKLIAAQLQAQLEVLRQLKATAH